MTIGMDVPLYVHFAVEGAGLLIAAAVAYGVVKTKLAKVEKDLLSIRKDLASFNKELATWKQERVSIVVTDEDCAKIQKVCRQQVCGKIEQVGNVMNEYVKANNTKWQEVATLLGAICTKMEIKLPDWK